VSGSRIRRPYEKFGEASEEAGYVGKVMDYVYEELHGKLMEILERPTPSGVSKDACGGGNAYGEV